VSAIGRYLQQHVYSRCGQAVSRLVAAELVARPEMPSSEPEVREWWLVSPELAEKLRAAQQPVLQFHELNMWGRAATGVALEDDEDLAAAIGPLPAPPRAVRKPAKPAKRAHKRTKKERAQKRR
jgi:hypothetical protein